MSNARTPLDSLTTHYLARELANRWNAKTLDACGVNSDARTLTIWVDQRGVSVDLRQLAIYETANPPYGSLLRGWTIRDVIAPTDERCLLIMCERTGKFRGSATRGAEIVVSFVPNARGAVIKEGPHVLGAIGRTPASQHVARPVLSESAVRAAVETRDGAALLHGRWMSPDICSALFEEPAAALERYASIIALPEARPSQCGSTIFPLPLCASARSVPSLIRAAPSEPAQPEPERGSRTVARMRDELARARQAPLMRAVADALIALGSEVPAPENVRLPDGSRHAVMVERTSDDTAVDVAERLYKMARAMERALATLPAKIQALESDGPSTSRPSPRRRVPVRKEAPIAARPYKEYRSSGGLEILVGRGAKSNDELTYEIARPADVWLHARDVTGAHVVLRWTDDGNPPAKDLAEAAALAAWHSKSRGSTVVPVDWTRRRHVRRARGGPAGRAIVERAKTVMARPSAALEKALRSDRVEG